MLAALGGTLVPGFELVADELDLADAIADADLVVTGEGHLDAQSFHGKVVGGVASWCGEADVPVAAIVGIATTTLEPASRPGRSRNGSARTVRVREPLWCIEQIAADVLRHFEATSPPRRPIVDRVAPTAELSRTFRRPCRRPCRRRRRAGW
jgi:hypothetical protein